MSNMAIRKCIWNVGCNGGCFVRVLLTEVLYAWLLSPGHDYIWYTLELPMYQGHYSDVIMDATHQPHDYLLNRLFKRRSKKISKHRVTCLCGGNSPVTGEFTAQKASNAEIFSFDDVIMLSLCSGRLPGATDVMESIQLYCRVHINTTG